MSMKVGRRWIRFELRKNEDLGPGHGPIARVQHIFGLQFLNAFSHTPTGLTISFLSFIIFFWPAPYILLLSLWASPAPVPSSPLPVSLKWSHVPHVISWQPPLPSLSSFSLCLLICLVNQKFESRARIVCLLQRLCFFVSLLSTVAYMSTSLLPQIRQLHELNEGIEGGVLRAFEGLKNRVEDRAWGEVVVQRREAD